MYAKALNGDLVPDDNELYITLFNSISEGSLDNSLLLLEDLVNGLRRRVVYSGRFSGADYGVSFFVNKSDELLPGLVRDLSVRFSHVI